MQKIIYYILAMILLIYWLGPYILIIVVILAVIVLLTKGKSISNNESINQSNNDRLDSIPIKDSVSSYTLQHHFEISHQQGEQLQAIKDILMTLKNPDIYKIIHRLSSFHIHYWKKKEVYTSLTLYDYILKARHERIETTKRDFVKRACEVVMQIVRLLKDNVPIDEVVRTISLVKENGNGESDKETDRQYVISQIVSGLLKNAIVRGKMVTNSDENNIAEERLHSNKPENGQDTLMGKEEIIENKTLEEWKWIENLKLREEANRRHQMGRFDEEINFIKNVIHHYELPDLAHKYWNSLLEKRMTEYAKLEIDRQYTISQIMYGLLQNAIGRENINDENEDYGWYWHSPKNIVEKKQIDKEKMTKELTMVSHDTNGIGSNVGMMDEVPYWKHMYVYSVADLQNANPEQEQFYYHFKASFFEGDFLDIKDNSNYAFVLMFDIADDYRRHKNSELLKRQLETLAENYPVVAGYINNTLSKTIIVGNQEEAERELQSYNKSRGQLCRWVQSNEVVEVQGVKLTCGNFYIGECFLLPDSIINNLSVFGYKNTYIYASVLNPHLPANNKKLFKNNFCTYRGMSPAWRYEYLMWLSGTVDISEISTEILLFYLYGCEIRMFIDPQTKKTERREILVDAIQLHKSLDAQLNNKDVRLIAEHLCRFIGNAIVKYFGMEIDKFDIKNILKQNDMCRDFYILQKMKGYNKFSSDATFDIACQIYDIGQHIPSGYISEAKQFFSNSFTELSKDLDLSFELGTQYPVIDYRHNYLYFHPERINFYYKISSIPSDIWKIHNAIRNCCWSVESKFRQYNRIKERSGGKETIAAITLLPAEVNIKDISKIQTLIAHIENEMQSDRFLVKSIDWILALWEYERKDEKSIYKEYADAIIGGLRRIGFDIVPDYEIDKKRFNFGDICVIYKNEECHSVKLTTKYERSDLFIKLASRIVNTDKVTDEDFIFVEQYLQSYNNTVGNHLHLMATIRWRFSLKKQAIDKQVQNAIGTLTSEQRISMGNALIRLACINGDIHPKRIDSLKKVLPLLEIDAENIHSQIHRLLTDSNGFAVIEKKSDAVEFTINGKSSSSEQCVASHVIINQKRLRTLEQQTKVAREILSDIFAEEETTESKDVASDNMSNMWKNILKLLFTKEIWKRDEIEDICKKQGLMLGAVLEQINDYAYERVDDAVVEDDDENIYVTLDYKKILS